MIALNVYFRFLQWIYMLLILRTSTKRVMNNEEKANCNVGMLCPGKIRPSLTQRYIKIKQ